MCRLAFEHRHHRAGLWRIRIDQEVERKFRSYPLVNKDDLVAALKHKLDVRVMHVTPEKDHIWSLNLEDKNTLSNAIYERFGLSSS
jgi:hypothetical protein